MSETSENDGAVPSGNAGNHTGGTGGRAVRRFLFAAIGLLYVLSVPWYRETGGDYDLIFGLPDWTAVAIGCYLAIAVLNAIAWQLTEIVDPEELEVSEEAEPPGATGGRGA